MTMKDFADSYRVRARKDGSDEMIIPGKRRLPGERVKRVEHASHIYDHAPGRFGLMLFFSTRRRWNFAKRSLAAAGFEIRQDGDTEGTALFDPADAGQATLALKLARVRTRRILSESERRAAADRIRHARGFKARKEKAGYQAIFPTQAVRTAPPCVGSSRKRWRFFSVRFVSADSPTEMWAELLGLAQEVGVERNGALTPQQITSSSGGFVG